MTTIPSRLAKTTISSGSWPVAQARARSLYRAWYRSAPEIVTLYAANIPATAIRAKIRQRYERNKYVDDLQAVDVLLAKSQMDYQETLNAWKMDSHLMRMFNDEEMPPQPVAFLDKFYYSRDDPEAVQPGA